MFQLLLLSYWVFDLAKPRFIMNDRFSDAWLIRASSRKEIWQFLRTKVMVLGYVALFCSLCGFYTVLVQFLYWCRAKRAKAKYERKRRKGRSKRKNTSELLPTTMTNNWIFRNLPLKQLSKTESRANEVSRIARIANRNKRNLEKTAKARKQK